LLCRDPGGFQYLVVEFAPHVGHEYAQAEAVVDTSGRTLKQSTKVLVDVVLKLEVI
jgi:hypothetical protein